MTVRSCRIEFKSDHALTRKIREGWFTDERGLYLPIANFPPVRNFWIGTLRDWCKANNVEFLQHDMKVVAKVKKDQIVAFIDYAFETEEHYRNPAKMLTWKGRAYLAQRLIDLRSFVAQQLNPRLWYELVADES